MDQGTWEDNTVSTCIACPLERRHTWCAATDGGNPLAEFVEWVLHGLNRDYKTIAFAHYGGRYDLNLVVGEL